MEHTILAPVPLARVRLEHPDYPLRLDNLVFDQTDCTIGADPGGDGSCGAGPSAPPPVPDGIVGTPLRLTRADGAGIDIDVRWDATTCPASGYDLLYGDLAAVGLLSPTGSACGLGTSGSYGWSGSPTGDLWILVVGDDGAATEGSWGVDSAGAPRRAGVASGQCDNTLRSDEGTCQ